MSITIQPTPRARPTPIRHYVLAALLVITAINYIQRNCISPAATTIEAELGITGPQLDFAAGAFFLAYTLMQVPSGTLAQRWGSRLMLSIIEAARSKGLSEIMGLVLTQNAPMLKLMTSLGFSIAAYPEDPDFRLVTKAL